MTTAREMQERCAKVADERGMHGTAAAIRALPCDESPTALSSDAREALTFLAELDGGLPRAPMPVAGSEECYPGPDVPTRVVSAALRALNREPADKPPNWQEASISELQAEIGRLQGILHFKVLGDPRVGVSSGAPADAPIGAEAIGRLYRPWRETTIDGPAPTRHRPK